MAWSEAKQTSAERAPFELLEDGCAPDPCQLLVIGCGNILRGDDAVGPVLVRHLYERGVPSGVRIVDGGTSGMDVAFSMRGAERVVIVDAAQTGAEPGTVYQVPAAELAELPPLTGLHTHNFRWDHAIAFGSWLLGPHRPEDITVFLIESESLEPGAPLSQPVSAGLDLVVQRIVEDFYPVCVELTAAGYLHLGADLARQRFPGDVLLAKVEDGELWLIPLLSAAHGGLVLKQRNLAGDRSVLIHEVLNFNPIAGSYPVQWHEDRGALQVLMFAAVGAPEADRPDATAMVTRETS